MAVLNEIQRGTITLADLASSVTVDQGTDPGFDNTVTLASTILFFSIQGSGSPTADNFFVAGTLTDTTTITFSRTGTSGAITIEWLLVSFTSGVIVQHFETAVTGSTATQAITGATAGGRFIVPLGGIPTTSNNLLRQMGRLKFNSDTEVGLQRGTDSGDMTYHYQVVEYVGCTVQEDDITFTDTTNTTDTFDISSAVTIANTLLIATCYTNGGNIRDGFLTMDFADTDTINFIRSNNTSRTFNITLFTVEFTDGSVLRQNAVAHGSGTGTVNTTITAVVVAESIAVMSGVNNWWACSGRGAQDSTAFDRNRVTNELTTTTNHQSVRGDSVSAQNYHSQVLQFNTSAGGVTIEPGVLKLPLGAVGPAILPGGINIGVAPTTIPLLSVTASLQATRSIPAAAVPIPLGTVGAAVLPGAVAIAMNPAKIPLSPVGPALIPGGLAIQVSTVKIPLFLPSPSLDTPLTLIASVIAIPLVVPAATPTATGTIAVGPIVIPLSLAGPAVQPGGISVVPGTVTIPLSMVAAANITAGGIIAVGVLKIPLSLVAPGTQAGVVTIGASPIVIPFGTVGPSLQATLNVAPGTVAIPLSAVGPSLQLQTSIGVSPVKIPFGLVGPGLIPGAVVVAPGVIGIPVILVGPGVGVVGDQTITTGVVGIVLAAIAPEFVGALVDLTQQLSAPLDDGATSISLDSAVTRSILDGVVTRSILDSVVTRSILDSVFRDVDVE